MVFSSLVLITILTHTWLPCLVDARKADARPPRYRTLYACEGSSLEIVCEEGTHVNLIRANFGRFSISVCNENGNGDWSVDCMSRRSFRVMQESCGMKRRCTLPASANMFGDPCPGTLKYLEAHYQCIPDNSQSPFSTPRSQHSIKNPLIYESSDRNIDNLSSSTNPRIIFPHNYNPSQVVKLPVIETDTKQSDIIDFESNDKKSEEKELRHNLKINENDIPPPPMNPPLISDNEPPVITSDDSKHTDHYNDFDNNHPTIAYPFTSTQQPYWISGDEDMDKSINYNDINVDHCPPLVMKDIFWNWTLAGSVANHSCPNGGEGLSRWSCVYLNGVPAWTPDRPDMSHCSSIWVSHLEQRINSGLDSVLSLADELAKNCKEKLLFGGDLFRVTDIINHLVSRIETVLETINDDQTRRHYFVKELLSSIQDIVSSLLDDNQLESWFELSYSDQRSAATSMINGLERMGLLLAETKYESSDYIRAHHNIFLSVHVRQVSTLINGLHLPPIPDSDQQMPDSVMSPSNGIHLTQQTLAEHSTNSGLVKVVFLMYKKLSRLLTPNSDNNGVLMVTDGGLTHTNVTRIINSDTIGILLSRERYTQLSEPIELTLNHLTTDNVTHALCVFWDIQRKDWSQQGCYAVGSNRTHTTCKCNHLTNFAILMDVNSIETSLTNQLALRYITLIGCILSIICLTLTFITLVSFRSLKSDRNTIHTHLCLCLTIAEMIFVLGINQTTNKLFCGLIAISLHYFFLASFLWMFFEGFQLYVLLVEVFDNEKSRINYYYLLSYGVPAVIVMISAMIDPLSYGTVKYCWLRADNYFIWSFVGPVIAILVANSLFLTIAMTTMCRHVPNITNKHKEQTNLTSVKVWIRSSSALVILLGLTWTFGMFYITRETIFMAYLFTITNSLQGLFIFVFNCLFNDKVRAEYCKLLSLANLRPFCLNNSQTKSADTSREQIRSSDVNPDQRTSLYSNNSNPKESSTAINSMNTSEPLIVGNSIANGILMGSSVSMSTESPTMRRSAHKYYLTDDSSDYGCKRLQQNRYQKQSCRDIYSLHGLQGMSSHPPSFIEHIYECIDEDPYVAKLLLPAIQRSLDGQHIRTLSDSSRHSDDRPLISSTSPRNHSLHLQSTNAGNHLPAIVRDNTANKTTIICSTQPTVALLNGNQVICCALSDHQLCDHNQQSVAVNQSQVRTQFIQNSGFNCLPSNNRHLCSDC